MQGPDTVAGLASGIAGAGLLQHELGIQPLPGLHAFFVLFGLSQAGEGQLLGIQRTAGQALLQRQRIGQKCRFDGAVI